MKRSKINPRKDLTKGRKWGKLAPQPCPNKRNSPMLILSAITISLAIGCAILAVLLAAQEPESS